jgi:hypothetical protein
MNSAFRYSSFSCHMPNYLRSVTGATMKQNPIFYSVFIAFGGAENRGELQGMT